MSDLIDRQALCEYALNQKDKSVTPNDIMRFPSADLQQSCNQLATDCISRQAAIDKWDSMTVRGRTEFDQVLLMMPSAQPEIVRCKECKFYRCDGCFFSTAETEEDGFCSWAERREDGNGKHNA